MNDRHTADTITDDALDALYEQLDAAEESEAQQQLATAREAFAAATTRAARAEAALDRVRALHQPQHDGSGFPDSQQCSTCSQDGGDGYQYLVPWPCPTIRALDGEQPAPVPAATDATELEKTTRVFAALHHSAEEDVTRVINLYEQWAAAGPPPLGTSIARWWDARLVELHEAIRPSADQPKEQPVQQEKHTPVDWKALAEQNERRWKDEGNRRAAAEAERDGAYRERAHLVALLAAMTDDAVMAPALDIDEPGWWIVYLTLGGRQCSWHISPNDGHLFNHVERIDGNDPRAQWDGHTTEEKYRRIAEYTAQLAKARQP